MSDLLLAVLILFKTEREEMTCAVTIAEQDAQYFRQRMRYSGALKLNFNTKRSPVSRLYGQVPTLWLPSLYSSVANMTVQRYHIAQTMATLKLLEDRPLTHYFLWGLSPLTQYPVLTCGLFAAAGTFGFLRPAPGRRSFLSLALGAAATLGMAGVFISSDLHQEAGNLALRSMGEAQYALPLKEPENR